MHLDNDKTSIFDFRKWCSRNQHHPLELSVMIQMFIPTIQCGNMWL